MRRLLHFREKIVLHEDAYADHQNGGTRVLTALNHDGGPRPGLKQSEPGLGEALDPRSVAVGVQRMSRDNLRTFRERQQAAWGDGAAS
jgi:hypothetical protein